MEEKHCQIDRMRARTFGAGSSLGNLALRLLSSPFLVLLILEAILLCLLLFLPKNQLRFFRSVRRMMGAKIFRCRSGNPPLKLRGRVCLQGLRPLEVPMRLQCPCFASQSR